MKDNQIETKGGFYALDFTYVIVSHALQLMVYDTVYEDCDS